MVIDQVDNNVKNVNKMLHEINRSNKGKVICKGRFIDIAMDDYDNILLLLCVYLCFC